MIIDMHKLEAITSILLSKLRESNGNNIELPHDYYWDIALDDLYNPYQEPTSLMLGQLSDDWEDVQKFCESDDSIPHDLKRVAAILTALSQSTWQL